ncbi:MAG: GtrA family protein [Prevotellaceae bacterium]|jgi:putative flippase GtrA|nr:GtrA family protein [Prevotellaceae bacterium]
MDFIREILKGIADKIRAVIDFFYPPFRKFMSIQFFRYGAVGGANLLFDWVLYFCIFNFILHQQPLDLGFIRIRSDIAAFTFKFPIALLSGFLLQKYVTFSLSTTSRGRIQLVKYFLVVLTNLAVTYGGFYFFVDYLHFWPSITNAFVSIITVFFSYSAQRLFTFKITIKPTSKDDVE